MINTVIFDLSEVLLTGIWGIDIALSKKLGIKTELIAEEVYGVNLPLLLNGEITEQLFWKNIATHAQWGMKSNELRDFARDNFREIQGTRAIIQSLRQNYKLGLLSNHAKEWIEFCEEKFAYEGLFNACLYSFDIGACKPDIQMYETMLARLGSKAESSLFIDDNLANIMAAKQIGFTTIQFINPSQLRKDLQSLSVN